MQEVADLYTSDDMPWVIGYSGGKDSTAVLQLVWIALEKVPQEKRSKPVYVISTDTLVENPIVALWVSKSLEKMDAAAEKAEPSSNCSSLNTGTRKHFLGQSHRPRLSGAPPKVPLVHRAAQDHALNSFY